MKIPKRKSIPFYIGFLIAFTGLYFMQKCTPGKTPNSANSNTSDQSQTEVFGVNTVSDSLYYLPISTTGEIVHHSTYTLSYREDHEQAQWVAYKLSADDLSDRKAKRPLFVQDPSVSTASAHWNNYKNSGYTKGHLLPAADRKGSAKAYNETFFTSNVAPQTQSFNSGIWNTLENKTRGWAKKYNYVYVVTGSVLSNNLKRIGKERVSVPEYFYKIILRREGSSYKMIAFLVPHFNFEKNIKNYVVTTDSIEALTGIDFFPFLEDTLEVALEQRIEPSAWF